MFRTHERSISCTKNFDAIREHKAHHSSRSTAQAFLQRYLASIAAAWLVKSTNTDTKRVLGFEALSVDFGAVGFGKLGGDLITSQTVHTLLSCSFPAKA
jgi:hypothetical protein